MRERTVEDEFTDCVDRLGGLAVKILPYLFSGFPDRMALLPGGRIFFVELKAPLKKPKALQVYVHNKLRKLGFTVLVLSTIAEVAQWECSVKEAA